MKFKPEDIAVLIYPDHVWDDRQVIILYERNDGFWQVKLRFPVKEHPEGQEAFKENKLFKFNDWLKHKVVKSET